MGTFVEALNYRRLGGVVRHCPVSPRLGSCGAGRSGVANLQLAKIFISECGTN